MATKSFIVNQVITSGLSPFSTEMPPTSITGQPYLRHVSPYVLFNQKGSNAKVVVKKVGFNPLTRDQGAVGRILFRKLTTLSGGENVPYIKMDSDSPDLPAQVLFQSRPTSATTSDIVRETMISSEAHLTGVLSTFHSRYKGSSRDSLDNCDFVNYCSDSTIQRITLREGQGAGLYANTATVRFPFVLTLTVTDGSGRTYYVNEVITPDYTNAQCLLGVFNESGSGVVLTLDKVKIKEIGTWELPQYDFTLVEGVGDCGDTVAPVSVDSANSLPSGIISKGNVCVIQAGAKAGAVITRPQLRKTQFQEGAWAPGTSVGFIPSRYVNFLDMKGDGEIVLPEGSGVALVLKTPSALTYRELLVQFDVVEPDVTPGPGGGATCYAF